MKVLLKGRIASEILEVELLAELWLPLRLLILLRKLLSSELLLNLFASDTPLHDGAVVIKGSRIISAGVILPLSRQGISRYGTRHLAALGITERFDRCICVVISEETGTLSLANQGRLERPITSSRLQDLLTELIAASVSTVPAKSPPPRSVSPGIQDSLP